MKINTQAETGNDVLAYMRSVCTIKQYTPTQLTLVEWCRYWLKTSTTNIKESTLSSYEGVINNHIFRVFGDMKLQDITTEDVQLFVNSLYIGYQLSDPLKPKTIKNIYGVLHKVLETALKQHYLSANAAEGIVLPQINRSEPNPLNDQQLESFYLRIRYHNKRDLYLFDLLTGLREGEIIALTWDCYDPAERTLRVHRQLSYNRHTGEYIFAPLKNNKTRVLSLTTQAVDILNRLHTPSTRQDSFIFTNKNGQHYTHAAVYNSLKKVMCSIGLPNVTFHDLRHTHAVLSLKAGMDIKTLQHNLGHYSAAFTLDVYCHCLNEMQVHGAEQLSAYMMKYQ